MEKPLKKTVHYYPFGLKHKGYNTIINTAIGNSTAQKFKYNGVELNESLGLNLYEMDVRMYDPAIARFNGIDPVVHYSYGTSVAFDNNPVYFADPSGADAYSTSNTSVRWENNLVDGVGKPSGEGESSGCPKGKKCDSGGNVIEDNEPEDVTNAKKLIDPRAIFARWGLAISNFFKPNETDKKEEKKDGIKIFGGSHKVNEQSFYRKTTGPLFDILEESTTHSVKTYGEEGVFNFSTKTILKKDGTTVEYSGKWSLKVDVGEANYNFSTAGIGISNKVNFGDNSFTLGIGLNHQLLPTFNASASNKIGGVSNNSKVKFTPGLGTRLAALMAAAGVVTGSPVAVFKLVGL